MNCFCDGYAADPNPMRQMTYRSGRKNQRCKRKQAVHELNHDNIVENRISVDDESACRKALITCIESGRQGQMTDNKKL